jgi:hypothetical protein
VYDGPKYKPGAMTHKENAPPGFIIEET